MAPVNHVWGNPLSRSQTVMMLAIQNDSDEVEKIAADIDEYQQDGFSGFMRDEVAKSHGPILLALDGWRQWTDAMLRGIIPRLPPESYHQMASTSSSIVSLPVTDSDGLETAFVINLIDVVDDSDSVKTSQKLLNLDNTRSAKPVRIFYWTCEAGGLPDFPDRPFALLCVESENRMEDRIEDHFLENPRRWNRLTHSLHWLVVDVFFIFNKWDGVIEATAEALTTMEVVVYLRTLPIMFIARLIHRDIGTLIELGEYTQLHQAIIEQVAESIKRNTSHKDQDTSLSRDVDSLLHRIGEIQMSFKHVDVSMGKMQKQLENLLSLAFNTETIEQSRILGRLTVLAFVFVPLSYVAALFSMQGTTFPTEYYPVSALPVLLLTLAFAAFSGKIVDAVESLRFNSSSSMLSRMFGSKPAKVLDRKTEEAMWKRSTRSYTIASLSRQPRHQRHGSLPFPDGRLTRRFRSKTATDIKRYSTRPDKRKDRNRGKDIELPKFGGPRQGDLNLSLQPSHGLEATTTSIQGSKQDHTSVSVIAPSIRVDDVGRNVHTIEDSENIMIHQNEGGNASETYRTDGDHDVRETRGSNYAFSLRKTAAVQSGMNIKLQAIMQDSFQTSRQDRAAGSVFTPSNYGIRPERNLKR
ncbi:uncharacterized protein FPRO_15882 [Fusarium proliferatum ET1]|uniref:Uncharacterized protein n=1 Tax=Fusarium proliferatum (strain ET1) TaxID=1227346 RepID=A0A1L7WA73_FUSPR|nr:uncharacterized protein FPRO_15882 [Fusarium proliferatum ET1]CZR49523.1 uncharacterized protein FPRO_15882 [Fusarium proliferatum ET1]